MQTLTLKPQTVRTLARPGKCTVHKIPTEHSDSTKYSCKDLYCSKLLDFSLQQGARALIDAGTPLVHDLDIEFCHDETRVASDFDGML